MLRQRGHGDQPKVVFCTTENDMAHIRAALEAGADDIVGHEQVAEVLVAPEQFPAVRALLEARGLKPAQADIIMRPGNTVSVSGEQAQVLEKLIHMLEDLDDVQKVYTNAEFA